MVAIWQQSRLGVGRRPSKVEQFMGKDYAEEEASIAGRPYTLTTQVL